MKEAANAGGGAATADANGPAPAAPSGGGFSAWLPLLGNLILMPLVAYAVTTYVLLPRLNPGGAAAPETAAKHGSKAGSEKLEKGEKGEKGEHKGAAEGGKTTAPLSTKVMVNIAGTMGTRFLITYITLVGHDASIKDDVKDYDVQLRDAAASLLAGKTLADLEKPGARNLVRAELISAFNNVLGKDAVAEVLIPDFNFQ